MPRKENELYLTKGQIQRLCELYQEEEHLWNIQSPHYYKKDKKCAALNRIKENLDTEFDDLPRYTVDQLWSKLANLRSYYTNELKKINDSKKSGAGSDEVYSSSWSHFEVLNSFLRSQVVPRKSTTNMDSVSQEQEVSGDEDNTASQNSEASEEAHLTPVRLNTLRKRTLTGPETIMQEATSVLSQIKSRKVEAERKEEDENDIFGKHVAFEMRKVKDPRSVGMARIKIQSILLEAQFNTQTTQATPIPPHTPPSTAHTQANSMTHASSTHSSSLVDKTAI